MACLLGKFAKIEGLQSILQCLSANYQSFDSQQAYSMLESINPHDFDKEYSEKIRILFEKYDILSVLNAFFERGDGHLNHGIFLVFHKMRLMICMNEAMKRQFNKVILCHLLEKYEIWDYATVDYVLNLLDYDVLLKGNPEETKAIIERYSTLEVFDNLIGRDNEVYLSNLRKICQEKYWGLTLQSTDVSEQSYEKLKNRINYIRDILSKNNLV
jgi:hypothetical protein